jgi:outer membrane protein
MRRKALLLGLAFACAHAGAQAQTFDEALNSAVRSNPNMEDARLGVRSAQYDRMQARAGYLPSLGLSGSYGVQDIETRTQQPIIGETVRDEHFEPSTASVRLSQQVFTGGRRGGEMRAANAGLDGARHALRATEQDVILATARVYLNVIAGQDIARLRAEQVEALERELSATQRRLQVGEVSRTDLLQVQTRLSGARADVARARADLDVAHARYEEVVGAPAEALAPAPHVANAPATLDEAIARGRAAHPDVLERRAQVDAARGRVAVERAALLPQVSIVGSYDQYEDDDFIDRRREGSSAAAQVSVPLFEGGYAWARMGRERVNVRRAEVRVAAAEREVASSVASAWSEAVAAREVVQSAREQVEASAQALAGAERERGLGLRTTIDVLNAQDEWRDAQIALARAQALDILAGYALLAATGALTLETAGAAAP